jgi:DNA-binding PadR family transcriptional regulator
VKIITSEGAGGAMNTRLQSLEASTRLTPAEFHILLALADCERHGYNIMQEIESYTDGQVRIGPATLYRTIKRLRKDGRIEETAERPVPELDDERRHYYRITYLGRQVLETEIRWMEMLVSKGRQKQPM